MHAVAGIAVIGCGLALIYWANSAGSHPVSENLNARQAARVSIWEIHNSAHIEFLPTQEMDDQSVIYTVASPKL